MSVCLIDGFIGCNHFQRSCSVLRGAQVTGKVVCAVATKEVKKRGLFGKKRKDESEAVEEVEEAEEEDEEEEDEEVLSLCSHDTSILTTPTHA